MLHYRVMLGFCGRRRSGGCGLCYSGEVMCDDTMCLNVRRLGPPALHAKQRVVCCMF